MRRIRSFLPVLLAGGVPAFAQCSMCRAAAAAQGPHAAHAMNTAVLILLVPALALFGGAFVLALWYGPRVDGVKPPWNRS
jgi:hypothetical protein